MNVNKHLPKLTKETFSGELYLLCGVYYLCYPRIPKMSLNFQQDISPKYFRQNYSFCMTIKSVLAVKIKNNIFSIFFKTIPRQVFKKDTIYISQKQLNIE